MAEVEAFAHDVEARFRAHHPAASVEPASEPASEPVKETADTDNDNVEKGQE